MSDKVIGDTHALRSFTLQPILNSKKCHGKCFCLLKICMLKHNHHTPNTMILGGETFGRWLDHEDGVLMNETSSLIKKNSLIKRLLIKRRPNSHGEKGSLLSMNQELALTIHQICQELDLGLFNHQNCEK